MSRKRAGVTTKEYLESAPLPQHATTYTVIPHKFVIDNTKRLLEENNLIIETELYKCNHDADVAQGVYYLKDTNDPELGMMFAWSNSYDKTTRFKCAIGAYVKINGNSMIAGDYSNWGRVHKGTADIDTIENITYQIVNAHRYYTQLISDKGNMKEVILTERQEAELLGRLLILEEFIDLEQTSVVRKLMHEKKLDYGVDNHSLWVFYNHIITSLKVTHPRSWLDRQKQVHWFLCNEFKIGSYGTSSNTTASTIIKATPMTVVPANQLDLENIINEVTQEKLQEIVTDQVTKVMKETTHKLHEEKGTFLPKGKNNDLDGLLNILKEKNPNLSGAIKVGDILAGPIVIERNKAGEPLMSARIEVVDFGAEDEVDKLEDENAKIDEEKAMERANPETYEKDPEDLDPEEPDDLEGLTVTEDVREALIEMVEDKVAPIKVPGSKNEIEDYISPEEQAQIDATMKAFNDKNIDFSL